MNIDNRDDKDFIITEKVFLVCIVLLIFVFNIGSTTFDVYSISWLPRLCSFTRYGLIAAVFINAVISKQYTVRELIIAFCVMACLALSAFRTHDNNLLLTAVIIFGAKNCKFNRIARVYFIEYSCICVVVLGLYFSGVLCEVTMERTYDLIRHSLGFNHPNLLGRFVFTIQTAMYVSFHNKKNTLLLSLISLIMFAFVWIIPNSRTSAMCILLLLFMMLFRNSSLITGKTCSAMIYMSPVFFAIFSILCSLMYNENFFFLRELDWIFTGRLSFAKKIYDAAGWGGLFGKDIYWVNLPLDNCYDKLLLLFGAVAFVIFIISVLYALNRCIRKSRYDIALCLVVFCAFGVFEIHTYHIMYNLCFFAITANIENTIFSKRMI